MLLTRVLLIDGRRLFRQGLRALLHLEPGFEIVGEAGDLEAARALCLREKPQIILVDAALLGATEAEAQHGIVGITVWSQGGKTLVLGRAEALHSDGEKESERDRMRSAHASAYLPSWADRSEFVQALHEVASGLTHYEHSAEGAEGKDEAHRLHLTEREREVMRLIAHGQCNKEIARDLKISPQTVKNHISHLLYKLALLDRTQLAIYFLEHHMEVHATTIVPATE